MTKEPKMKKITWGIHKELFPILTKNENFSQLFYDPSVMEQVVKVYSAERNELGEITKTFEIETMNLEEVEEILNFINDYFTDFFFRNQQRTLELNKKMQETTLKSLKP